MNSLKSTNYIAMSMHQTSYVILLKYIHIYGIIEDYSTLRVRYRDLQARVYKQETRNLTLNEAQPSAV